eukprot:2913977-Rhodomonas_salina.1
MRAFRHRASVSRSDQACACGQDSALLLAAGCGRVEAVQALLKRGADAKRRNERGWNALHKAAWHGQGQLVGCL